MTEGDRLNKALASAGVGSRRHCDALIAAGRVSINGQRVIEPGRRMEQGDKLVVDGAPVEAEPLVYWAVHKPRGVLCTNHDPSGRPLAVDLVPHVHQRVYTVGRLDEESEGLLLLTNDGPLALRLTHPRYGIEKTYRGLVAGSPDRQDIDRLLEGVWLSDGKVKAKRIRRLKTQGESVWLEIVLSEGKNREIRRMLAQLGHKVLRIIRMAIGSLKLDRLPAGKARRVSLDEVQWLSKMCTQADRRRQRLVEGDEMASEGDEVDVPEESPPPKPSRVAPIGRPPVPRPPAGSPPVARASFRGMPPRKPGRPDLRLAGGPRLPRQSDSDAPRPPRQPAGGAPSADRPARGSDRRDDRPSSPPRPPRGPRMEYGGDRDERPRAPRMGQESADRPIRGDRRDDRPAPGSRPVRSGPGGPMRGDRPPTGARPTRSDPGGPMREDRPAPGSRPGPGAPMRGDRRDDRPPAGPRPTRSGPGAPMRGDRPPLGARPPRSGPGGPMRGDRRDDRGGPGGRPPRPGQGRTDRPAYGGDRNDEGAGPRAPRPGSLKFEKGESVPSGYLPGMRTARKPGWKKSSKTDGPKS